MNDIGLSALLVIIANLVVSYKGFSNHEFFDSYKFEVDKVLIDKEYKRLITSGFLHVNWMHFIFNMISLAAFSGRIEYGLGEFRFLIIYFVSLIGGDLLSLFVHRNHGDYSAVGASGAVCGVIFASIALFPGMHIGFLGLGFSMPGWIYGILFVAFSIYGIKSKRDNIGHEAHLGGALIGMLVALIMVPPAIQENYLTILVILIPSIVFIYLILTRPQILFVDNFFFKTHRKYYSVEDKFNERRIINQKEIDSILDKIGKSGYESLSKKEKEKLREFSGK